MTVTAASRLTIVFAALAVSRWIEARTGWSIRKIVKTARYREIKIQAGQHTITAADPIPDDLRQALDAINHPGDLRTSLSQLGSCAHPYQNRTERELLGAGCRTAESQASCEIIGDPREESVAAAGRGLP